MFPDTAKLLAMKTIILTSKPLTKRIDTVMEALGIHTDEAFIRRALDALEAEIGKDSISSAAALLRAIPSETRSNQSRTNGAAPVRDGSRPRGRPRIEKNKEV